MLLATKKFLTILLLIYSLPILIWSEKSIDVDWDFEMPASIEYYHDVRLPAGYYHLYNEDGYYSSIPTDDTENGDVQINNIRSYTGDQSIFFEIKDHNNDLKDRVELQISDLDGPTRLEFGDTRYISYRMYIDASSKIDERHFTQVWQPPGFRVPFWFSFINEHNDWRIRAKVSRTDNSFPQITSESIISPSYVVGERPISKEQWHTFIYKFNPRTENDRINGEITIWIDGGHFGSYYGPWASIPGFIDEVYSSEPAENKMSIRCGLYTGHSIHQKIFFDDIRMGTSYKEVDPNSYLIELEAESGVLGGSFGIYGHQDASFDQYIEDPVGSDGSGTAEYTFYVNEEKAYNIWLLSYGESASNESFFISVNGEPKKYCTIPVGNTFIWRKVWHYNVGEMKYNLTKGKHKIQISTRERGAKLDKICIVGENDLKPSSLNINNQIGIEAESGIISSPYKIISELKASNGKFITQDDYDPSKQGLAQYDFYIPTSGDYNIYLLASAKDGNSDSIFISMDNYNNDDDKFSYCTLPVDTTDNNIFLWKQMFDRDENKILTYSLTSGFHSLKLKTRELNAKIDRIVIIKNTEEFDR